MSQKQDNTRSIYGKYNLEYYKGLSFFKIYVQAQKKSNFSQTSAQGTKQKFNSRKKKMAGPRAGWPKSQ